MILSRNCRRPGCLVGPHEDMVASRVARGFQSPVVGAGSGVKWATTPAQTSCRRLSATGRRQTAAGLAQDGIL